MSSVTFQVSAQGFNGDIASGFIVKHLFQSETLNRGFIYVDDNIHLKRTIRRIVAANVLQAYKVTPGSDDSQGDITVSGRPLLPQTCMIYKQLDPNDFESDWLAVEMTQELLDKKLPATAESYIIQEILRAAAKDLDGRIWVNDSTASGNPLPFDGLINKLAASGSGVVKIASPVTLTASNIISKLDACYQTSKPEVRRDGMFKIGLSPKSFDLYRQALVGLQYKGPDPSQGGYRTFAGVQLMDLPGIPDDCLVTAITGNTRDSNFWMGVQTKGATPKDEPMVKFDRLQNNSEEYFLKAIYRADVQIGWPEECVLYQVTS